MEQILPHSSQREPALLTPRSGASSLQRWKRTFPVVLATQAVVLCYGSLSRRTQYPYEMHSPFGKTKEIAYSPVS